MYPTGLSDGEKALASFLPRTAKTNCQNLNEFAQENNDIDNEYEKLSEIEVNCEPLPIPQNIVRFGSEGNLGISSRFVDFNPGIKELKTLRISKRFDKIAEHKPSIIIVYSLIRGKLKAYE